MKDATEILMLGVAIWFGLIVAGALLHRAPQEQPVALPEANHVMEAEDSYRTISDEIEAIEPSDLQKQLDEEYSLLKKQEQRIDKSQPGRPSAQTPSPPGDPAPAPQPLPVHRPEQPPLAKVAPQETEPLTYHWIEDLNAAELACREHDVPMFIFFTQPGCVPCGLVKQHVFKNEQVQQHLAANYVQVWVDCQKEPEIAAEFGVTETPRVAIWLPRSPEYKLFTPTSEPLHFLTELRTARERYDQEIKQ